MSDSCDPMDCSPLGSTVHGISQTRILEWVAISFSRGSFPPRVGIFKPRSSSLQANSLPSEPSGKQKTTLFFFAIKLCNRQLRTGVDNCQSGMDQSIKLKIIFFQEYHLRILKPLKFICSSLVLFQ